MLMYGSENWALKRSERMENETGDMPFLSCHWIYTYRPMTVHNGLQIYVLEERI